MKKYFTITDAYYLDTNENLIAIPGIPSYGKNSYGSYSGTYQYQAASKAFTGIQKFLKKFHKDGWFDDANYNPDSPPSIVFNLIDIESQKSQYYIGNREPASQGQRKVINSDGRVRNYKWNNKIKKITLE
jgi:hypothetical protein